MTCQDKQDITFKNRYWKYQIHQILRIAIKNGKTEYRGRTYTKNDVVLEPGWISDAFE